ncbi:MAG TPA: hypothetical protein VMR31_16050 [Myxococcota bacterium]|nr:hypothetical protein [Myxococcota bacterium]
MARGAIGRAFARACAAALLCGAGAARADDSAPAPERPFEFGLRASGFYGPIDGFVQVPLGGNPGTSSSRRPTLSELGISDAAFYEIQGRFRWDDFVAFAGYSGLDLDGSSTLDQPLVNHGVLFPAGDHVRSSFSFNVPNFGGGWRFELDDRRLTLMPKLDVALLDFSSSLDGTAAHSSRGYTVTAVRLGLEGAYQLGHGFTLELDGVASIPIPHWPQIASVTGRVSYALFPTAPVHSSVFLGLGGRWIDFKDSQALPNHIDLRSGPLATFGFTVSY